MSLVRAPLILLHAILYQLASTPPNKTPSNGRYDATEAPWIRIAPLVFKMQQPLVWLCTSADILLILSHHLPIPALRSSLQAVLCPAAPASASPFIRPTLPFFTGLALVAAGTLLRLTCYRSLGPFFTFDLALLPKHQLVTSGPYRFVRHPAYAGSLLILAGLGLADLSPGGWIAECVSAGAGPAPSPRSSSLFSSVSMLWAWAVFAVWYAWWLAVGVRRARMEDAALREAFGKQWTEYAGRVRWWFFPGVL
ncbi:hypothetical protein PYCCODRAFT_632309 [Trametes coccinea BRFM310]|uniref:Protein-S-isoprenylcysteine O-methyltransferase n=1 Tax=Trametes coccinea (strain BRFM310) TaxID=1353009 RepID=A0A1Y2J495_TRAC3|nr:hypothetical protein PYCCODRAFT_632309 [Trametes coccinea BRFM310]